MLSPERIVASMWRSAATTSILSLPLVSSHYHRSTGPLIALSHGKYSAPLTSYLSSSKLPLTRPIELTALCTTNVFCGYLCALQGAAGAPRTCWRIWTTSLKVRSHSRVCSRYCCIYPHACRSYRESPGFLRPPSAAQLKTGRRQSVIGAIYIEYLGHIISLHGLQSRTIKISHNLT